MVLPQPLTALFKIVSTPPGAYGLSRHPSGGQALHLSLADAKCNGEFSGSQHHSTSKRFRFRLFSLPEIGVVGVYLGELAFAHQPLYLLGVFEGCHSSSHSARQGTRGVS